MDTAGHIFSAIENGGLEAISDFESCVYRPEIVLLINHQAFCRIGCLKSGSPTVKVVQEKVVRITPSPGIRDGFKITCSTVDMAKAIAKEFQRLIDGQYVDMFDE